jgi:threonine/homoserine/homoserine lactone efflux protein
MTTFDAVLAIIVIIATLFSAHVGGRSLAAWDWRPEDRIRRVFDYALGALLIGIGPPILGIMVWILHYGITMDMGR